MPCLEFCRSGQICAAGSRILVEESVAERFIERFAERAQKLK